MITPHEAEWFIAGFSLGMFTAIIVMEYIWRSNRK